MPLALAIDRLIDLTITVIIGRKRFVVGEAEVDQRSLIVREVEAPPLTVSIDGKLIAEMKAREGAQ